MNIYIKFTAAQLQRRLVAVGDTVYCTPGLSAPVTALDAASGKVLKIYAGTERTQEFVYDRGVLYAVIGDPTDTTAIGVARGGLGASQFPPRAYGPEIPQETARAGCVSRQPAIRQRSGPSGGVPNRCLSPR